MILLDANVLIYAFRPQTPEQERCRDWLSRTIANPEPFGLSDLVLSTFLRIVTNPRAFRDPDTIEDALEFASVIRNRPQCVHINPGIRHWDLFTNLCRRVSAKGNLIPDAYLAALAIENGCEWITTDRDYARFPGLRWRHPIE